MTRRRALAAAGTLLAGGAAWRLWPEQGLVNPCLGTLPRELADHPLVREAFDGLDIASVWDAHVHLIGVGDAGDAAGAGFNDGRGTLRWPIGAVQREIFRNASCIAGDAIDAGYVARLVALADALPRGIRLLLLALDTWHDASGRRDPARTHVWIGNDYAARIAAQHPARFAWAASVHPWRVDAVAELERVQPMGACAVKWIPSAQNIDPASPRCDPFYAALAKLHLPLVTHAGMERAVPGDDALGNPLKLRRALEHGVTVIVAHCASMGESRDIDRGPDGPWMSSFALFERLMDEPPHVGRLFGDLSAITQTARAGALGRILARGAPGGDWATRLVNGSDYPLPAVMPLFSPQDLADAGFIDAAAVLPLTALRRYNALLFDFVQKRQLHLGGQRLAPQVFETRAMFNGRSASRLGPSPSSTAKQSSLTLQSIPTRRRPPSA